MHVHTSYIYTASPSAAGLSLITSPAVPVAPPPSAAASHSPQPAHQLGEGGREEARERDVVDLGEGNGVGEKVCILLTPSSASSVDPATDLSALIWEREKEGGGRQRRGRGRGWREAVAFYLRALLSVLCCCCSQALLNTSCCSCCSGDLHGHQYPL